MKLSNGPLPLLKPFSDFSNTHYQDNNRHYRVRMICDVIVVCTVHPHHGHHRLYYSYRSASA